MAKFLKSFLNKQEIVGSAKEKLASVKSSIKNVVNFGQAVVTAVSTTGIAGFKFDCPQSEQVVLKNNITTHYVENNSPVQDHIACEPVEITVRGFQGEYVYELKAGKTGIQKLVKSVPMIGAMMPEISLAAQSAKSAFSSLKSGFSGLKNAKSLKAGLLDAAGGLFCAGLDVWSIYQQMQKLKSPQTRAFYFLKSLRDSCALFTVETSWETFENMAIESLTPLRDNNADITDFTVKFKQIKFAETEIVEPEATGRTEVQKAEVENKGIDKGEEVDDPGLDIAARVFAGQL